MQTEQFEIVVILEGIVETTGEWQQHFPRLMGACFTRLHVRTVEESGVLMVPL